MFNQILDPTGNLFLTWLVALIPVVLLLVLLAGLRILRAGAGPGAETLPGEPPGRKRLPQALFAAV